MIKATLPPDEGKRLQSLRQLNLLDTPAEERFDRITRLARRIFQVPIAYIALVDSDRQWFKSAQGLEASETPREISFCGHTILRDDALIVEDASKDERFFDNPFVTGDPFIRFYAGHPVKGPDGSKVGTLCLVDRKSRNATPEDLEALKDLASMVESEFRNVELIQVQRGLLSEQKHLQKQALVDSLTRLWNRAAIEEILEAEFRRSLQKNQPFGLLMVDLDHFKRINDNWGHLAGDAVLREASRRMRSALRPLDSLGRWGGEEFLIVLPGEDMDTSYRVAQRIRDLVERDVINVVGGPVPLTLSLGVAVHHPGDGRDRTSLVKSADEALYKAKGKGRNRVEKEG